MVVRLKKSMRLLVLLAALPMLTACLKVEVVGSVVGADITIAPLRGGAAVVSGVTTHDVAQVIEIVSQDTWNEIDNVARLHFIGGVNIPTDDLQDDQFYLVTASGGYDMDADGDDRLDRDGRRVLQDIHAIMSGAMLKQGLSRVTLLSEAIYQYLLPELDELSDGELALQLDQLAGKLVGDVSKDGASNYQDVLAWSHLLTDFPFKGSAQMLERMSRSFADTGLPAGLVANDGYFLVQVASWEAVQGDTRWSEDIVACLTPVLFADLCSFATLPLIGMGDMNPSVADVMAHLVVSDDWMRDRFEQILYQLPDDLLMMFRGVTAVVVGAEVRPSYFDPGTGAIALDADYFWLTDRELQSISSEPDFRGAYRSVVSFADLWRYADGDDYAFAEAFEQDANGNRPLEAVAGQLASLLFHELAHAAGNIPPGNIAGLPLYITPYDVSVERVSDQLVAASPLLAAELYGIADVINRGVTPTPVQANYTGAQIGALFAPDGASDLYAYSSQFEDVAMLFEETMMAIHYGIARDIAFTSIPPDNALEILCSDYRVGWGVRGRIAEPKVRERAELAAEAILPEREFGRALRALPAPVQMSTNRDWCGYPVENTVSQRTAGASLAQRQGVKLPWRALRKRHDLR